MTQRTDLLGVIFILTFFGAMLSCSTPGPLSKKKEVQSPEATTPSNYTPVLSWADKREVYIAEGLSESEADTRVEEGLTSLANVDRSAGDDCIGVAAPPFQFDGWLNTAPLTVEDLRGKVVLIRWWTDTCPFCASSSPALRTLHDEYANSGLTVIGVFHPKAGRNDPLDVRRVQDAVEARNFKFPIAIDWDWRNGTLKKWWLTGPDRPATSVTFLLDKSGVIRFVNPAMEYHDDSGSELHAVCANDMGRVRAEIEQLIAE